MKVTCQCSAVNRVPSIPTARLRCGACKHEFTPRELMRAVPEPPEAFALPIEDDLEYDDEDEGDDE